MAPSIDDLKRGCDVAWREFIGENQSRWIAQARRYLKTPSASSDGAQDVVQEAITRMVGVLQQHDPSVADPQRYMMGIVRRAALESKRKAKQDCGTAEDTPARSTTSERVVREDEVRRTRRTFKEVLERARYEVLDELCHARRSDRGAPLLHWAWFDLATRGITKAAELAEYLGLSGSSELVKLRTKALERLVRCSGGLRAWEGLDVEGLREAVEAGAPFAEAWDEERYGCIEEMPLPSAMVESHRPDWLRWRHLHDELLPCSVCREAARMESKLPADRIEEWALRASRHLSGALD